MILLSENNYNAIPKHEPTTFLRQYSASKSISRKVSSNSNSFPLQPLDNSNFSNTAHLCRSTTLSRNNSSKSTTSDLIEKLDFFSQLTPEQLEELAKACEELQQKQQTPRISSFVRSLSQQQQQAANCAPYKLSQLMMGTMDQQQQQQQLNQQVPYPYYHSAADENNFTAAISTSSNDSSRRTAASDHAIATLMEFMDNEENQFEMEALLGGVPLRGGPTLGEINANVSTRPSSTQAQEVIDITADDVGYILNENQTMPEYLGAWPSSTLRAPVFSTASNASSSTLQVPTMANSVQSTSTQLENSSIPSYNYNGGSLLPVRNSAPAQQQLQQPLVRTEAARKPVVVSKSLMPVQKTEPVSVMHALPQRSRNVTNSSKRALYENEQEEEEEDIDTAAADQSSNQKREWWEYNVNHRGQRLDSVISRMRTKPRNNDPHVLPVKEDPVFDAEVADTTKQVLGFNVRHGGKARIGNGNDLTPRPERLRSMKNQIEQLDAKMDSLAVARDDSDKERTRKRREKNRLASRVCRLKRKAQHEANKIMLYGLETEHRELISALDKIKAVFRAKINGTGTSMSAEVELEAAKQSTLLTDCDVRPQAFVNNIINEG